MQTDKANYGFIILNHILQNIIITWRIIPRISQSNNFLEKSVLFLRPMAIKLRISG